MTRVRVAAAIAAVLTALLLQATLVGPLALTAPVSLPALLVAAIALVDGPGSGIAFGFAAGLLADLGSEHPAGILALCWLGVGLIAGLCASPGTSVRRDAALAAVLCGLAGLAATLAMTATGTDGASVALALREIVPSTLVDALLALVIVPVVRGFLHSPALRAPRPVPVLGLDG